MEAKGLLSALTAHYVSVSARRDVDPIRLAQFSGMSELLIHAATVIYDDDEETATERIGDMITDIMLGMD